MDREDYGGGDRSILREFYSEGGDGFIISWG